MADNQDLSDAPRCFVSGTGTVASWGWLRKTWIIYRVASNTASEDDMQFFQRAIKESTEFERLANQWQNIYSACHCSSQCCGCSSERSKYAARIRIAIRRVKDGMELPPWGPPLRNGDENPKFAHTPPHRRDELEIMNLLSQPQRAGAPVIDILRRTIAEKSRKRPLKAQRLKDECSRLEREAHDLAVAATAASSALGRRSPDPTTMRAAEEAQERLEWAQKKAELAQQGAEKAIRLQRFIEQIDRDGYPGPNGDWGNRPPGHWVPCAFGPDPDHDHDPAGSDAPPPSRSRRNGDGRPTPAPSTHASFRTSTTRTPLARNPGGGVPSPAGGDEVSPRESRYRPVKGQSAAARSTPPQPGTAASGGRTSHTNPFAGVAPPLDSIHSQNLDEIDAHTPRTLSSVGGTAFAGGEPPRASRLGVHSAFHEAAQRDAAFSSEAPAGMRPNLSSASLFSWTDQAIAAVHSSGSLQDAVRRQAASGQAASAGGLIGDPRAPAPVVGERPEHMASLSLRTGREGRPAATGPRRAAPAATARSPALPPRASRGGGEPGLRDTTMRQNVAPQQAARDRAAAGPSAPAAQPERAPTPAGMFPFGAKMFGLGIALGRGRDPDPKTGGSGASGGNQGSAGSSRSGGSASQSGLVLQGASQSGGAFAPPEESGSADSPRSRHEGKVLARVKQEEETLRVQGGSTPRFGTLISPIASPGSQGSLSSQGASSSRRRAALPVRLIPEGPTSASASKRLFATRAEAQAPALAPCPGQDPSLQLLRSRFADSSDGSETGSPRVAADSPSVRYAQEYSHGRGGTPQGWGKGKPLSQRSRPYESGAVGDTPTRPLLEPPSYGGMDRG
ncbi:hypothetical protein EPUS_00810 [Endocarpon pusillum Z07020]|uniref:Uncharacterized protein n=1 Tax=Endocarpon pusillum (strain Z07020 / HMAS-L-300199) TaxID=1263415 RepID=U1HVH0_ENDPU|nr:uncharacterized protein EPUS_00810 [Endocarpon pusillum Z07020]ERF74680.1 hypothetical protein EPUS_00810 [Endocarpon pusillum Z07020]